MWHTGPLNLWKVKCRQLNGRMDGRTLDWWMMDDGWVLETGSKKQFAYSTTQLLPSSKEGLMNMSKTSTSEQKQKKRTDWAQRSDLRPSSEYSRSAALEHVRRKRQEKEERNDFKPGTCQRTREDKSRERDQWGKSWIKNKKDGVTFKRNGAVKKKQRWGNNEDNFLKCQEHLIGHCGTLKITVFFNHQGQKNPDGKRSRNTAGPPTPPFSSHHAQKAPISASVRGSCSSGTQLVLHLPDICIIDKLAS